MAGYVSGGLAVLYCMAGFVKIAPFVPPHQFMKNEFVQFATVFPLKPLGINPSPTLYMYAIGLVELGAGVMLGLGSPQLQVTSATVLVGVMVGAIYTLMSLGRATAECIPAAVCLSLLGLFLFQTT